MLPRKKIRRPRSLLHTVGFFRASLLLISTFSVFSPFTTSHSHADNLVHLGLDNVHQAQQLSAIPSDMPTVVFYHIFIPQTKPRKALDIVKKQVEQFGKSYAASTAAASRNQSLHVQYVTVGRDDIITDDWMNQTCDEKWNLRCSHLKHAQTGFEEVTLSAVHDFCLANPKAQVTYVHNKGSYHVREGNDFWRYALTEAVLSHWCINRHKDCNICGLQFYTIWAPFLPGNMWTANCSYIRKLLRPVDYAAKSLIIAKKVLRMRLKGQLQTDILQDLRCLFGLDRFANELWVGSHPTVKPCDCDRTGNLLFYFDKNVEAFEMSGAPAPRHVGSPSFFNKSLMKQIHSQVRNRLTDYFILPGNLIRWYSLYGEAPDDLSWAWTWFPDGDFWKQQTRQWGASAVEMVSRKYTTELLAGPAAFVDEGRPRAVLPFNDTIAKNLSHAIFYDFHISQKVDDMTYFAELSFAANQLRMVLWRLSHTGRDTSLFYRTMGHKSLHDVDLCLNISLLECRRLGHEDAFYAGEILLDVHAFCERSPNSLVSLIHNIPPRDIDGETPERKHRFLRHATMASMSNECLVIDGENCNLCGLAFFTEPKLAMAGDMWTASCSYINRLHPPVLFQEKMGQFIEDALVMKVSEKLEMGLYAPRVDVLGLDKFAVEHWVGSHPSLLPCDVSAAKFSYWLESEPRAENQSMGLGARYRGSPFSYDQKKEALILEDNSRRGREFSFLPGQLMKWYHLYGEIPSNTSWVWSWFPDGFMWLSEVSGRGKEAVDIVTEAFVRKLHQE